MACLSFGFFFFLIFFLSSCIPGNMSSLGAPYMGLTLTSDLSALTLPSPQAAWTPASHPDAELMTSGQSPDLSTTTTPRLPSSSSPRVQDRAEEPAAHPDLSVERLVDVNPIVLAVGQGVGASLPDKAGGRVGADGTA